MKEYVCITECFWGPVGKPKNPFPVGSTIILDKEELLNEDGEPCHHFVPHSDIEIIRYAKKRFGKDIDRSIPVRDKVDIVSKWAQAERNAIRQQNRLAYRKEQRNKSDRMDSFLEQGMKQPAPAL